MMRGSDTEFSITYDAEHADRWWMSFSFIVPVFAKGAFLPFVGAL